MSWFNPQPLDAPIAYPKAIPPIVVPSFIHEDGQVLNHLWHHGLRTRVQDYSNQGNNGTLVGATWLDGSWGWCLEFDGNDYISMVMATPNWGTAITVEVWFNHPKDLTLRGVMRRVGRWSLEKSAANNIEFYILIGGVLRNVSLPAASWTADTWSHLVYTVRATTDGGDGIMRAYANNVLAASSIAYAGAITAAVPEIIGARTIALDFLDGLLAFPRVYNRVLTALERTQHFERTRSIFGV